VGAALVLAHRLLIAVVSLLVGHRLWRQPGLNGRASEEKGRLRSERFGPGFPSK